MALMTDVIQRPQLGANVEQARAEQQQQASNQE